MPIHGVSDRNSVDPRFKTIGKLRKGSPKQKQGNREIFGTDLTYFRFTSDTQGVVESFARLYGSEPRTLTIYLPYGTMEENFGSWRELYGQNGLVKLRCDGATWTDWIEGSRHYHGERECDKAYKDTRNRCSQCPLQPVGRLSVILPDLWYAGHIGLVTLETHSWNDIHNISSKLVQCEPLTGKPFTLWRDDTRIGAPNEKQGTRMAVVKSLVYIELTSDYLLATFQAAQRQALAAVELASLPESISETDDDETLIEGEAIETEETMPVVPIPSVPTVAQPKPMTVNDLLVAGLTAQQIMDANDGRIPATSEECERVMEKVRGGETDDQSP